MVCPFRSGREVTAPGVQGFDEGLVRRRWRRLDVAMACRRRVDEACGFFARMTGYAQRPSPNSALTRHDRQRCA
jgi:hypothetical protein